MIFLYRYQDRDRGVVEGSVSASSEADAYSMLRKQGVRPMNVWPKPGFVNRLSAIGKRGLAIVLLSIAVVVSVVSVYHAQNEVAVLRRGAGESLSPLQRQQLPPVAVEFPFVAERTLALFARPGSDAGLSLTNGAAELFCDLDAALQHQLDSEPGDTDAAIRLKRIVAGLKFEVRMVLASGRGVDDVLEFLLSRQRMENAFRTDKLQSVREGRISAHAANEELRAAGLAEIGLQESKESGLTNDRSF